MSERPPDNSRTVRFVVVGGGVSGLAAARVLAGGQPVSDVPGMGPVAAQPPGRRPAVGQLPRLAGRAEVILLESTARLGGKILTGTIGGIPVELGPDQFLRRDPSAERLAGLLGLGPDLVAPAVRAAGVYSRGRLRALPGGLILGVPTDPAALEESGILPPEAVAAFWRLWKTPAPARALSAAQVGLEEGQPRGESEELAAGVILRSLLGDEVVDRLVDPLLGGINGGSVDHLSLATVAPQIARLLAGRTDGLAALAAAGGGSGPAGGGLPSPFFGLVGGLSRLVDASRRELTAGLGAKIVTSCGVDKIERHRKGVGYTVSLDDGSTLEADGVVVATSGPEAGRLLDSVVPEAAERLAAVPYASVALATMAFEGGTLRAAGLPDDWSGVLVPRVEGAVMTAVSFLSAKWPWMARAGGAGAEVIRVSAGRYFDDRISSADDAALVRRLLGELSDLIGIGAEPTEVHLQRWDDSFPQYRPGHGAAITVARRALSCHRGLAVAGAVLGGIGIPACISSGERAADEVLTGLDR